MALVKFAQGLSTNFPSATKDANTIYFCTDTHQLYLGANEYTKSTKVLNATPTATTAGDAGRLYAYNNDLWLCEGMDSDTYVWTRVANLNTDFGTVTSVGATDGVETDQLDGNPITGSGFIKHSVPTGASTVVDDLTDQTPAFGSTFAIKGVSTDKFGHVIAVNNHAVTIPVQTSVTVDDATASPSTLSAGDSFTVITGVAMSTEAGATDHDLVATAKTFTLPADQNVTYSISSVEEGVITLSGSDASASTALINGWNDLAKKSDITTVFRYKGTVATVADLQTVDNPQVGDVYQVTAGSPQGSAAEYVCTNASSTPTVWEELGTTVDLSAYATTAYVDDKLTWQTF